MLQRTAADRATAAIWRCAARALGVPLSVLRRMTDREIERLLRRARRRAEQQWTRAGLRVDAIIAAQDSLREGRR